MKSTLTLSPFHMRSSFDCVRNALSADVRDFRPCDIENDLARLYLEHTASREAVKWNVIQAAGHEFPDVQIDAYMH